jgi:AcrR family transcriptional regulator
MPHAERRTQLLRVAHDIIVEGGIGALTMSGLAERSGASKPVVYEHFENSEAVAIALLDGFYRGIVAISVERIRDPQTIFEYFDIVCDCMFDYYRQEGPLVRSITNGFASASEVNAYYLEQQARSLGVYRTLLLQQGIAPKVAGFAAYTLSEMISHAVMEFAKTADPVHRDTLKRMVRGVVQSLAPGAGIKPSVPSELLEAISTAGEHWTVGREHHA